MKNLKLFIVAAIVGLVVIGAANINKIEENLSWMFEADDSQIALPELSNKEIEEVANKNKTLEVENIELKTNNKTIDKVVNNKNEELEEITN